MSWIQAQKGEAKKAGILAAVAKVPTLLKKLQASADAAVAVDARAREKPKTTKEKEKEKDEASLHQSRYIRSTILVDAYFAFFHTHPPTHPPPLEHFLLRTVSGLRPTREKLVPAGLTVVDALTGPPSPAPAALRHAIRNPDGSFFFILVMFATISSNTFCYVELFVLIRWCSMCKENIFLVYPYFFPPPPGNTVCCCGAVDCRSPP